MARGQGLGALPVTWGLGPIRAPSAGAVAAGASLSAVLLVLAATSDVEGYTASSRGLELSAGASATTALEATSAEASPLVAAAQPSAAPLTATATTPPAPICTPPKKTPPKRSPKR